MDLKALSGAPDAVGGVIQIITRRGEDERNFGYLKNSVHGTFKTGFGVRGASEREDYSLFVSRLDTDGFSEASRTNPNLLVVELRMMGMQI